MKKVPAADKWLHTKVVEVLHDISNEYVRISEYSFKDTEYSEYEYLDSCRNKLVTISKEYARRKVRGMQKKLERSEDKAKGEFLSMLGGLPGVTVKKY